MSKPIKEIEGIGPANAEKLATAGIHTVEDLLNTGCTKQGRDNLATKTGLTTTQILEWVNMADLFRVEGIGQEYSDLLEEAGVAEGTSLRLGVEVNAIEAIKTVELWQAELAKIGIDLIIEKISAGVRWGEVYNPDTEFDIMLLSMIIGFDSPNEYLGSVWHSGWTWYPFAGFDSQEFNDLVLEALSLEAVDKAESDRLYQEAEQILFDQASAVFALDLPQDWAMRSDVGGFKPNPLYSYDVFFWQMYRE